MGEWYRNKPPRKGESYAAWARRVGFKPKPFTVRFGKRGDVSVFGRKDRRSRNDW